MSQIFKSNYSKNFQKSHSTKKTHRPWDFENAVPQKTQTRSENVFCENCFVKKTFPLKMSFEVAQCRQSVMGHICSQTMPCSLAKTRRRWSLVVINRNKLHSAAKTPKVSPRFCKHTKFFGPAQDSNPCFPATVGPAITTKPSGTSNLVSNYRIYRNVLVCWSWK